MGHLHQKKQKHRERYVEVMGEFMGFTGKGIRFFFCMFPMWKKYISAWKVHTL